VSGHTLISSKSCNGPRACSETPTNTTIGISSCVGSDSCGGGYSYSIPEALFVADEACYGDRSCFSTRGLTYIGNSSCVGVGEYLYLFSQVNFRKDHIIFHFYLIQFARVIRCMFRARAR
jgi:hypothetical protein